MSAAHPVDELGAAVAGVLGDVVEVEPPGRSIGCGCLVVSVDDPAFAERLAWSERQVLARLDALVGAGVVDRLDVRVRR